MVSHLLVGNPTAQSGKGQERIERALELMSADGMPAEFLATLPEGKTIGAVSAALDGGGYSVVVAMGGDGTFREVAAGLYTSTRREEVALGMLPAGTANDQGRSFGLTSDKGDLERNVGVIRTGHETRLDVGIYRAGDDGQPEYFFDSCGWGLSARVLAKRNQDRAVVEQLGPLKEIYRDQAVYAGAFLKTFLESYVIDDKFQVVANLDGQRLELEGLTDLIVKNTRVYAGAWVLDETSRHDDGIFELVPFVGKLDWTSKAIRDLEVVPLNEEILEELGLEHSKTLRASVMDLEFFMPANGAPLATQLDGEEWPAHPRVRIEVAARALRLIVPQT
ncbi:MAG: diacylglycerol kinase catalytic region [Polyangiaceae bacterium]|jgi:diacylglycerol kinase family enzyme|nr:diacylglycerol kinase catalytic region [Polyangiaceae bacterium]